MANDPLKVIAGIDTHADTHRAAVIAETGARLADREFLAVGSGYNNRQGRRLKGKSDPIDAYQAAEPALARRGTATPNARDGAVESLRVLRVDRC